MLEKVKTQVKGLKPKYKYLGAALIAILAIMALATLSSPGGIPGIGPTQPSLSVELKVVKDPCCEGKVGMTGTHLQKIMVTVKDSSGNLVDGANVLVKLYMPDGTLAKQLKGMTDSKGHYDYPWYIPSNETGTWKVVVTAEKAGYSPGTATVTFKVVN